MQNKQYKIVNLKEYYNLLETVDNYKEVAIEKGYLILVK